MKARVAAGTPAREKEGKYITRPEPVEGISAHSNPFSLHSSASSSRRQKP